VYTILVILSVLTAGCGTLPRDPENTLNRVREQHRMRVGLVEHPPWVVRSSGEPVGAEVQLARQFGSSIGANPEWFWNSEQQHMQALGRFELDLVIGGLDASTPWTKKVGITRPYFEERFLVGVPSGTQPPGSLRGVRVAVKSGEATAAYLIEKHATPLRVSDILHASGPAAAPDWELRKMGFTVTEFELLKKKHVMAVPPGENGWLKQLEEFLGRQRAQMTTLLQNVEPAR
jgi:polar amino acid transport system substrate-binding protein